MRRQRIVYRLLEQAEHAHQRRHALQELARMVGGTLLDAQLIFVEYRRVLAEEWLRDQQK